ncbi:MAG: DUF4097 family beta strand repeat-containing protein [Thermoanaerobaculales bacterium]|jgi:DUF4097 and DUF4098 domain-containing protein YvlB|nr:DUF4097 family beta strand repeat-containing protein [Thermoanaerobaculales bacterium]
MQIIRPLVLTVALTAPILVHADVDLRQEHTFDARPGQTLVIDVSFHRVEVLVEPGSTVHAVVELSTRSSGGRAERAIEEYRPVFQEKGDTLLIRSVKKRGWSWKSPNLKGRVTVTMPPDLDLSVDSSSGSITIEGDLGDGEVSCDASSGSVTADGTMRSFRSDTSSGSTRVSVSRPLELFSADSSSGSIRLEGGAHKARADASSGSIWLDGLLGDAAMDTSSGSITAQWDAVPAGASIDAGASSGSITLRLPAGTVLSGSVDTSSGGIRSDFPGTFKRSSATFNGGAGAVELQADTSSGSVKILEN